MNTIPELLQNSVYDNSKKTAVISNEEKYSYKEIDDLSSSVSTNILQYPRNSVVSLMLENSLEFIVSYLGILKVGKIAHIIPPNISKENLTEQIKSANPTCLISSKCYTSKLNSELINFDVLEANEILSKHVVKDINNYSNPDGFAYLIYTSGTTSKPKGIGITHKKSLFTTNNIVNVLGYKNSDIEVLPLSLSHSFGLGCLHTALFVGSTIILHKNAIDVENVLNSITRYHATTLAAVPATLTKMVENFNNQTKLTCENLRLIITNSTAIPELTVKKLKNIIIIHMGGWKKLQDLQISKEQFNQMASDFFNCKKEKIIDIYGMTEQLGTIYPDCDAGYKHVPTYSEIMIRNTDTLEIEDIGKSGFIQLLSPIPHSYPGISLLSDDIGKIIGIDNCPCGRKGKYFQFEKRAEHADIKGCGDTID